MIEYTTEHGEDRKQHHTIRTQKDASIIIVKNEISKVLIAPTRLAMIVEPKKYKLLKDKTRLGGYLRNDVSYIENLFIYKIGYKFSRKLNKYNDIIDLIDSVCSVQYKINKEALEFTQLYGVVKCIIISLDKLKHNTRKVTVHVYQLNKFIDKPYIKRSKKLDRQL